MPYFRMCETLGWEFGIKVPLMPEGSALLALTTI